MNETFTKKLAFRNLWAVALVIATYHDKWVSVLDFFFQPVIEKMSAISGKLILRDIEIVISPFLITVFLPYSIIMRK